MNANETRLTVLFYSTTLLSPLFPSQAAYLAFYLTAFNARESEEDRLTHI